MTTNHFNHRRPAPLMTPEETAHILGISMQTLAIWRSEGRARLPFIKVGRRVMYRAEDVFTFISTNTQESTIKEVE